MNFENSETLNLSMYWKYKRLKKFQRQWIFKLLVQDVKKNLN